MQARLNQCWGWQWTENDVNSTRMSKKRLLCALCISIIWQAHLSWWWWLVMMILFAFSRIGSNWQAQLSWWWWLIVMVRTILFASSWIPLTGKPCFNDDCCCLAMMSGERWESWGLGDILRGMQRKSTMLMKNLIDSMEIMRIVKKATGRDLMTIWCDAPYDVIHMWWDMMTITIWWQFSRW